MSKLKDVDYLIVGGGFYGCCLSLFLRSISKKISLVETEEKILGHASRVNQARIHTGFHYPRSAVTAVKSMILHARFISDFPDAVADNFQMLYAISRRQSKVSAKRFFRMFSDMGAPISYASSSQSALFDSNTIEGVFECTEYAFNYSVLSHYLQSRIDSLNIDLKLNTEVIGLDESDDFVIVKLSTGEEVRARYVFNVTYSNINHILNKAKLPTANLKYELTEIALVEPPKQIVGYGITVMDGPFFSIMPFPAKDLYSLTHVRYTPHMSWTKDEENVLPYDLIRKNKKESKIRYMVLDGRRYVPCLTETKWKESLYEVKTVLLKNECDDGRPILYQREPFNSRIISIMGGKIDNIYDLFDLVKTTSPEWSNADDRYVYSRLKTL